MKEAFCEHYETHARAVNAWLKFWGHRKASFNETSSVYRLFPRKPVDAAKTLIRRRNMTQETSNQ